jgi:hypothetical protein
MSPPRWSTLTAARDKRDPSKMPATSASSPSNIAAIAHLWDGMPTITTTASSVVWVVGVDPPSYRLSFRRQRSSEEDQADFESQQGSQRRIAKPILRAIDRPSSVVDDDRLP